MPHAHMSRNLYFFFLPSVGSFDLKKQWTALQQLSLDLVSFPSCVTKNSRIVFHFLYYAVCTVWAVYGLDPSWTQALYMILLLSFSQNPLYWSIFTAHLLSVKKTIFLNSDLAVECFLKKNHPKPISDTKINLWDIQNRLGRSFCKLWNQIFTISKFAIRAQPSPVFFFFLRIQVLVSFK